MANKKKDKQKIGKPQVKSQPVPIPIKPFTQRSPIAVLEGARDFPFLGCWMMSGWRDRGITPVVVARLLAKDRVVFASFLVDHYCLGVKNALYQVDIPQ